MGQSIPQNNMMNDVEYRRDKYGFLKQVDPQPFAYTPEYKAQQSTDTSMSWLRLGWLMAHIGYDSAKELNVVDIGAGNGSFVKEGSKVFKRIVPYDLAGESITDVELYGTAWDLIVMSDVLEHYQDIDDLWSLNFRYGLISFPETPINMPLTAWKHYKVNEHLYCLTKDAVVKWVDKHGYSVLASGCPEDAIRKRWNNGLVNISTILISKKL